MRIQTIIFMIFFMTSSLITQVMAQNHDPSCAPENTLCLLGQLETLTDQISDQNWKDQTYRETAKLLTKEKQDEAALALIEKIKSPDTKAMTIRGIGMAAAHMNRPPESYPALFSRLRAEAEKITHPPSYAIALTYIAMAQAFAGDDQGASATAHDMKNDALRHKAFAESAEIQAEHGRFDQAMQSIAAIQDPAFRDKAHRNIAKILADRKQYHHALQSTMAIENTYQKAQSLLYILAKQITPEEVSLVE